MRHCRAILSPTGRPSDNCVLRAPPPRPPLPAAQAANSLMNGSALPQAECAKFSDMVPGQGYEGGCNGWVRAKLAISRVGELNRAVLVRRQKNSNAVPGSKTIFHMFQSIGRGGNHEIKRKQGTNPCTAVNKSETLKHEITVLPSLCEGGWCKNREQMHVEREPVQHLK
jgi:hypothetical protein